MDHPHHDHAAHGMREANIAAAIMNATTQALLGTSSTPQPHHNHQMSVDHSSHMTGGHAGHSMPGCDMMNMKMYFHFGYDEPHVLFENWTIDSVGTLIGSMLGLFFMAIIYEGLKYFRERLFRQNLVTIQYSTVTANTPNGQVQETKKSIKSSILAASHFIQTALHLVQITLAYILMLAVMTFNGWLCIAVVLGATVGYFLFGWQKSNVIDISDHCH